MQNREFRMITNKYFDFLVQKHGFIYNRDKNLYINQEMLIYVFSTNTTIPGVELYLVSEPEFTRSTIEDLLADYISRMEFRERAKKSLEENFQYFSTLFLQYTKLLFVDTEKLILLHMKRRFVWICRIYGYTATDYLLRMEPEHQKYYDYIKVKEPNWNIINDWNLADVWLK